jgi:hypothetical protein
LCSRSPHNWLFLESTCTFLALGSPETIGFTLKDSERGGRAIRFSAKEVPGTGVEVAPGAKRLLPPSTSKGKNPIRSSKENRKSTSNRSVRPPRRQPNPNPKPSPRFLVDVQAFARPFPVVTLPQRDLLVKPPPRRRNPKPAFHPKGIS